ncbi:MAG: hypothetical protein ABI763_01120 [Bacteroidota bacterium]
MIIVCKRPGQLGNSLFLFAHFIAYSLESDTKVVNLTFYEYADYFSSTRDSVFLRIPGKNPALKIHWLRKPIYQFLHFVARIIDRLGFNNSFTRCIHLNYNEIFFLDDELNRVKLQARYLFAQGWLFRCVPYFKKHQDYIRNYFQLVDEHRQNVARVIAQSRQGCELLIGLHIRHGDYAQFEGGKYFYSLEQYYSMMLSVTDIFKGRKIRFLISSNSKHDYSIFKNMDCCFPSGHEVEDMYALSYCDYLLGPPSTYTMWASFYGKVPLYRIKDINLAFSEKDFLRPEDWM